MRGANPFSRTDYSGNAEGLMTGMVFTHAVLDGLGNVFLCGERNIDPDRANQVNPPSYDANENGWTIGKDHDHMCRGSDNGYVNFYRPIIDTPGVASIASWQGYGAGIAYGSPHLSGFHVAMGSGSVLTVSYSIDDTPLMQLSRINDGGGVDALDN
jgi:hypothetical protein